MASVDEIIYLMKKQPIEKQLECGEKLHEIYEQSYRDMKRLWNYTIYALGFVTLLLLVSVWYKLGCLKC